MIKAGTRRHVRRTLVIDGQAFSFYPQAEGWAIYRFGAWCGWSAGTLADAKNTARDLVRTEATR